MTLGPFTLGPHGEHRGIYTGDARALLPQLPEDLDAVVLVTDPPYGIALRNHALANPKKGRRSSKPYRVDGDDDRKLGLHLVRWAAAHALPAAVFASPWHPWPGYWRNLIVWDKGPSVGFGGDVGTCLKRNWELIQVTRNRTRHGKREGCVWSFPVTPHLFRDHPMAKPVPLLVKLIKTFTDPGDIILDPCIGSGTTAVAAILTGRRYLGFEIDPGFATLARRRVEALELDHVV